MRSYWSIVSRIFLFVLLHEAASSTNAQSSSQTSGTDPYLNCTTSAKAVVLKGRLYSSKTSPDGSGSGMSNAAGSRTLTQPAADELTEKTASLDENSTNEICGKIFVYKNPSADDKGKTALVFGSVTNGGDDGKCVKKLLDLFVTAYGTRSAQCLVVIYVKKDGTWAANIKWPGSNDAVQDKISLFVAETSDVEQLLPKDATCFLSTRSSGDDDPSQQDSLLNNFSRTSVLFVSVSFIILMVISLAWLVFYYVQRFRYAHAKDRLARRLFNAAKKALTKIPAKTLRQGDKELDSDCPVCIEPYHSGDVIRILPCKHVFHKTCVDPWLLEHRTCPMCKMDILKAFGYHFGHSEESVRDADQLSAGGQSTDGGSGTGAVGRSGSVAQHGFPISLPTDSDLHDPFFPSPISSPSLLQPVLHSGNAQSFTIIPLTVHRLHGGGGSTFAGARVSDSSADSADNWETSGVVQRQHSAEVHYGPGSASVETQTKSVSRIDDNHNDTTTRHSSGHQHRRRHGHRDAVGAKPSTISNASTSSSSSSTTASAGQQRQPLFHSRSASVLRDGEGPLNTVDSCESDDGCPTIPMASTKRRRPDEGQSHTGGKFSAIVSRARSSSQTAANQKARVAVSSTPPLTAAGQSTTTTTVIGRASSSSLSSGPDCVVVGVVNSSGVGASASKGRRNRNTVGEQSKGSPSLESL